MTTLTNLLDDMEGRMDAVTWTALTEAKATRYINHGLRAMFPSLYKITRDTSLSFAADTYEYTIPASMSGGRLLSIEYQEPTYSRWLFLDDYAAYRIVPGDGTTGALLEIEKAPGTGSSLVGQDIRITAAKPFTVLSAGADVTDVPAEAIELPVLYAMGLALGDPLEERTRYRRYSTTMAENGVDIRELMAASQYWFAQFELLLSRIAYPLPGVEL